MQCYRVLVHGVFDYNLKPVPSGLDLNGFYAGRSLFARDELEAERRAFLSVRKSLSAWNEDIRDGLVSLRLNADEINRVPFWYVFKRSNRGHIFYGD
jgi:hypothetical protein